MKRIYTFGFILSSALCLSACRQDGPASWPTSPSAAQTAAETSSAAQTAAETSAAAQTAAPFLPAASDPSAPLPASSAVSGADSAGAVDRDTALAIALANASVAEADARHIQIETDGDNGIPIYDIEFETTYGDYNFEVSINGGVIVGADYEVDDEWLSRLGGSPTDLEGAKAIVQSKVPGAPAEDIRIWEEGDDGRLRYEGELFYNGMKYEFEIDPNTGIIFDWNGDLRE